MASSSKSKVYFFYETPVVLRNKSALKQFIEDILKKEGRKLYYINYIFCSDKRLIHINRQFLNHDYYTDIIAFELSSKNQSLEAEIYISTERVKDNVRNLKLTFNRELLRVMIHGLLHLCGYSDKTPGQIIKMRKIEDHYLNRYLK